MAFSIEGMARDMLKTRKGMPRYLEMLGKAREAGTVAKDCRGAKRAAWVGMPKRDKATVRAAPRPTATVDTLAERYRKAKLTEIQAGYSKRDATDGIKSAGNGL